MPTKNLVFWKMQFFIEILQGKFFLELEKFLKGTLCNFIESALISVA